MSVVESPNEATANISSHKILQNEQELIKLSCRDSSAAHPLSPGVWCLPSHSQPVFSTRQFRIACFIYACVKIIQMSRLPRVSEPVRFGPLHFPFIYVTLFYLSKLNLNFKAEFCKPKL